MYAVVLSNQEPTPYLRLNDPDALMNGRRRRLYGTNLFKWDSEK